MTRNLDIQNQCPVITKVLKQAAQYQQMNLRTEDSVETDYNLTTERTKAEHCNSYYRGLKHNGTKLLLFFLLLLLFFHVPENNFSVMLGRSIASWVYQYFFGVNMSCSRTQHSDPSGNRTPDLWIRSPRC